MKKENAVPVWRRLLKAALLFVPLLVFIAVFNVVVDPANLYRRDYEINVAQYIAAGKNVTNLKNMNDRIFQRHVAQLTAYTPHTLVLGSSRSMQLSREITGCETMYNAAVTNGDLRDMISLYMLYRDLGKKPDRVILMTDYCLFNTAKLDGRAFVEGYSLFAQQTGTEELKTSAGYRKWLEVVSPAYFQDALRFIEAGHSSTRVDTTDAYQTDTDMRRADGSYSYGLTFRNMTDEERIEWGKQMALSVDFYLGAYEPVSVTLQAQFELFVDMLIEDGVQVVFQLPPLNPHMYEAVKNNAEYASLLELEDYFYTVAKQKGVMAFGSYSAEALGLKDTDFYDSLHCSMEATASYFPQELRCDCGD